MTERQRRILHLLVGQYIETRAPVASGTLAERLSLSPATVRYELIELEQQGFISKPHASSGRIPTRAGFRHYALSKLPPQPLPQATLDKLAQVLEGAGARREALLVQVASKLSGYPAMLRLKPRKTPRPLQVHLSTLTPGQVLAVAVLEGGKVREARLELSFTPTEAQLAEAERWMFRSSESLRASTPAMLELYESVARAFAQGSPEEYREGMALLLSQPEAQNPAFLRQAIAVFESPGDATLTPPGGMNIRVGEEEGISLVQAGIGLSDRVGELTLLGPLRMHYDRALSVAYALGQVYMGKQGRPERPGG